MRVVGWVYDHPEVPSDTRFLVEVDDDTFAVTFRRKDGSLVASDTLIAAPIPHRDDWILSKGEQGMYRVKTCEECTKKLRESKSSSTA